MIAILSFISVILLNDHLYEKLLLVIKLLDLSATNENKLSFKKNDKNYCKILKGYEIPKSQMFVSSKERERERERERESYR